MCTEWGTDTENNFIIQKQTITGENTFICYEYGVGVLSNGDFKHHMQTHNC